MRKLLAVTAVLSALSLTACANNEQGTEYKDFFEEESVTEEASTEETSDKSETSIAPYSIPFGVYDSDGNNYGGTYNEDAANIFKDGTFKSPEFDYEYSSGYTDPDVRLYSAGLTASELPEEAFDVPEDWDTASESGITFRVPAGSKESDIYGKSYFSYSGDTFASVYYSDEQTEEAKGFSEYLTDKYSECFGKFGLTFDGTECSIYKDLLAITSEDIENTDDDTRETLDMLGNRFCFAKKAYILEKGENTIIILQENTETSKTTDLSLKIFTSENKEISVAIYCSDEETALKIAASFEFTE
ncbi:MAG: hypothetical protein K5979_09330 [Ruminococcus sp.]|nr:hypothetical protein [Ruminococcus sp.]